VLHVVDPRKKIPDYNAARTNKEKKTNREQANSGNTTDKTAAMALTDIVSFKGGSRI